MRSFGRGAARRATTDTCIAATSGVAIWHSFTAKGRLCLQSAHEAVRYPDGRRIAIGGAGAARITLGLIEEPRPRGRPSRPASVPKQRNGSENAND